MHKKIYRSSFGLALGLALGISALADELKPAAAPAEVQVSGGGHGLREGALHTGLDLGEGLGAVGFHTPFDHDIAIASLHLDRVLSPLVARGTWYSGHWEWLNEVFGGTQYYPMSRYVCGVMMGLRYDVATGTRWVPFAEAGVGLTATDIGGPDLSGNFQFNDQAGFGFYYFFRDDLAVTVHYRWLHLSNGGLIPPNHGINTQTLLGGLTWFF